MLIYFTLYAFLGYLMESFYISILQKKWISSGLLNGPFIPLYGIGAIALIIFSPYLQNPFLAIVLGGIILTGIEYGASLYIEKVFQIRTWDYSKHRFNYQGRICFLYFLIWCGLSYLFIFNIHPYVRSFLQINDFTLIISLIISTFILKSFIDKINKSKTILKKGII